MNEKEFEQLKRDMEEVIALPESDEGRQGVLDRIADAGPQAEAYWLALVDEDEQLRMALRRVEMPADLKQRLVKIPGQTQASSQAPVERPLYSFRRWATSAAALILVGVSVFVLMQPQTVEATDSLAMMAITHHNNQPADLPLVSDNVQEVEQSLSKTIHFKVGIPKMDPGYKLVGGGKCALGGHSVIYTRWVRDGKTYTLYQFCKHYFDIESDMPEHEVQPKTAGHYKVSLWSKDKTCAYAFVQEVE